MLSPCKFGGNTLRDEIPRGQRCDCQAAGVGGASWAQLGPWDDRASTLGSMSMVRKQWLYLCTGTLLGPTRNFSKFQATSLQHTEDQVKYLGPVMSAGTLSLDAGRVSGKKASASVPTCHSCCLKLGWNLLPGQIWSSGSLCSWSFPDA